MSTVKQVLEELSQATTLKDIASAYSEISSVKLTNFRQQIEGNVNFALQLASLLHIVRTEAAKQKIIQTAKKPQKVHIVLTSNYKFYGKIERDVMSYFLTSTQLDQTKNPNQPPIRIVIGKTGVSYLQDIAYRLPFTPFIFSGKNDLPKDNELAHFIVNIKNYKAVFVYHSRFKSIVTQIPVVSDITQQVEVVDNNLEVNNIFEPDISKMLEFFDSQIIKLLFEGALMEAEISRTASRMVAMTEAQSNADNYIKLKTSALNTARVANLNKQILESLSSLYKWRQTHE